MRADWHFARHQPGGPVYNPLGGEHFNQGAVGDSDWEAGESLVRESIQNSLDARAGDEEVSVVFHVGAPSAMTAESAAAWFGPLWPHLRARECKLARLPERPRPGGVVVVEDFGTRGLEGDVAQWRSPREGEDNDFFSFFRAEGLSGKTEKSAGSWGVGKSVFSRCSLINTFLAVSVRRREGDVVLIGKSLLWHHYLGQDECRAVGQFGHRPDANSDLVLPTDDAGLLRRLATDFRIRRPLGLGREGPPEPGLSVVIPYSDPDITAESLLLIVVREYFRPILGGRLRVTVHGLARGSVSLDSDSIRSEVAALGRPELSGLLALADWARGEGIRSAFTLREPPKDEAPRWDEALFPSDEPGFKALCERFERGEPVSLRVPVRVHPTQGAPERSFFDVFLQRDPDGDGYRPVFVRAGIVVPNARERAVRGHSLFALVTVDDRPLAVMLRAAEPPAHTTWSHMTQNFKGKYEWGRQTIDFVVGAPKYIADILSSAHSERDLLALAEFFPEPDDEGRDAREGRGKRKGKGTGIIPDRPPPRPKPFRIVEMPGGFRVTRDNRGETTLPARLVIRVAYDTSRGSALGRYHPADFLLPKLAPRVEGAAIEECEENRLVVAPRADDFEVEINGFDENRDLYVKVQAEDAAAPEGGEA